MKSTERKEICQNFELDGGEVTECFASYLKGKGAVIPDRAEYKFNVKIGPTDRQIKTIQIMTRFIEEGLNNGNGGRNDRTDL